LHLVGQLLIYVTTGLLKIKRHNDITLEEKMLRLGIMRATFTKVHVVANTWCCQSHPQVCTWNWT